MILPSGIIVNWSNVEYVNTDGKKYLLHCHGNSVYITKEDYDYIKNKMEPPK